MAELIKKYPNTELWIVGDGAEKSNLKSKISKLKLENNVKLLGWQNNPDEFYSQADAFCSPQTMKAGVWWRLRRQSSVCRL